MWDLLNELDLDKMTREMMILSGFELGARSIIDRNSMKVVDLKYDEDNTSSEMLENNDTVREVNRYAFFNQPSPTPRKTWTH